MKNPVINLQCCDAEQLNALSDTVRNKQCAEDARAISRHLAALAVHARNKAPGAAEMVELLEQESLRFEHQSQEVR